DRPPQVIRVLCIVESNHGVRKGQVEQGKNTSASSCVQIVSEHCRLSDLIPVILDRSVPEFADRLLLFSRGRAVQHTNRLHFLEGLGVLEARQTGGWSRTELASHAQGKGHYLRPMGAAGLLWKIRGRGLIAPWRRTEDIRRRRCRRPIISAKRHNSPG